jgi:hypothetical protein
MSLYFAPTSRKYACRIASVLTSGMPQIAASTARRSMVRRARSSEEKFCVWADAKAQIKASAARTIVFMFASRFDRRSAVIFPQH